MAVNTPRKYEHIWQALKLTKGSRQISYVTLTLPKESHDTVLLALRKECIKDLGFRAICIEEGICFSLGFNRIGDTLQLYLKWKPYITNAFVITPERIKKMKKW